MPDFIKTLKRAKREELNSHKRTSCNLLGSQFKHHCIHRVLGKIQRYLSVSNLPSLMVGSSWICLCWYHLDYLLHLNPRNVVHWLSLFPTFTHALPGSVGTITWKTKNKKLNKKTVLVANNRKFLVCLKVCRVQSFIIETSPLLPPLCLLAQFHLLLELVMWIL